jgi:hypothetical protein
MEKEELTPEQAHYAAMEEFVCATHNIRFKETHENWRLMMEFLSERELPVNMQNLRFAYLTLSNDDLLDLLPLGHLARSQPPEPETTPPAAQPAPVVPIKAKTFAMFRNGQPITGNVRSLWGEQYSGFIQQTPSSTVWRSSTL